MRLIFLDGRSRPQRKILAKPSANIQLPTQRFCAHFRFCRRPLIFYHYYFMIFLKQKGYQKKLFLTTFLVEPKFTLYLMGGVLVPIVRVRRAFRGRLLPVLPRTPKWVPKIRSILSCSLSGSLPIHVFLAPSMGEA